MQYPLRFVLELFVILLSLSNFTMGTKDNLKMTSEEERQRGKMWKNRQHIVGECELLKLWFRFYQLSNQKQKQWPVD